MSKLGVSSWELVVGSKSRKGQDKLITVYWFFILLIIAGGVVMMVNTFYSSPYDVREMEARVLTEKVFDCIYSGGVINPSLNSEGRFLNGFKNDFFSICDLNFVSSDDVEYYVSISISSRIDKKNPLFFMEAGNLNFKTDCGIEEKADRIARCYIRDVWILDLYGRPYLATILSAIRKVSENE
jgi:hypothetical protein